VINLKLSKGLPSLNKCAIILFSSLDARLLNIVKYKGIAKLLEEEQRLMAVKLHPLADRLVVKPVQKEEMTKGGIYLPDTAKEKPQEGEIVAVGPGKMTDDGKRIPMEVKVGDRVIYSKYGGSEIKIDDVEMIILRESDILAVKKG
jgi:chaperonin GroES